jgi:hypothetical protein
VDADEGAVDDGVFKIRVSGQDFENLVENPSLRPSSKAAGDRVPVPESVVEIAPWRTCAHDPKHGLEKEAIVGGRPSGITGLAGEKRRNPLPLLIAQNIPIQG